jgi:hypothetical protein
VLNNEPVPGITESKALCGWRFDPGDRTRVPVDAIIFGPDLRRAHLNIPRSLINQWVKDAARKSSLWSPKELSRLPNLLVVLEKWTSPTWTRIQWEDDDDPPGTSILGLVSTGEADSPTWEYLALPDETLNVAYKIGNTTVPRLLLSALSAEG